MNKYSNQDYDYEDEDDLEVSEKNTTTLSRTKETVKRFLKNVITGSAIGAGVGGAGGYLGAKPIRDAYITPYGFDWSKNLQMPLSQMRGATVPAGILSGAVLGGIGGATLPYIFQKSGSQNNNKYANQFWGNLKKELKELRPFDQQHANAKLLPLGLVAGSLAGGVIGGLKTPRKDEKGRSMGRSSSILKGMAIGGGLGGLGGLAIPTAGTLASKTILPSLAEKLQKRYEKINTAQSHINSAILGAAKDNAQHILPQMSVSDFAELYRVLNKTK
jgi:hypothetical protein